MINLTKKSFGFMSRLGKSYVPTRAFSNISVQHKETPDNNDSVPFEFTDENYKQIEILLKRYPSNYKRSAIIPVLTIAQKQNDNFLSLSAMRKVAKLLEVPEMDIFEVASFYTMFNRERVGKIHLQVCGTTPCLLCGADKIIAALEKHLGIKNGETTPDGWFTIQEVECLGACANAPMIQVNGEWVYEDLTPESVITLIEKLKKGEKVRRGPQTDRNDCEGPQGRTTLKDFNPEKIHDRDFAAEKVAYEKEKELKAQQAKEAAAKGKK